MSDKPHTANIWQNMMDKLAGRPTEAEIRRQEPGEGWAQEQRDAITHRSRHNDITEMRADGIPEHRIEQYVERLRKEAWGHADSVSSDDQARTAGVSQTRGMTQ